MKIKILLIFLIVSYYSVGQGTWVQVKDLGTMTAFGASAFVIGNNAYLSDGTGNCGCYAQTGLWEWSATVGEWTPKGMPPYPDRAGAIAFSIGTKGYTCSGSNFNDLWEWNKNTNNWTQKANLPGTPRWGAEGFAIGNKGYITCGEDTLSNRYNDLWEWNQSTNTWLQKANLPSPTRVNAVCFVIGTKAYVGTGRGGTFGTVTYNDLWEWNSLNNTWSQKSNLPGMARSGAVGFSIGSKGYITTGDNGTLWFRDLWEWDQATNTWVQKANLPSGRNRSGATGYAIGGKGYIISGVCNNITGCIGIQYEGDYWSWDQATNTWSQLPTFMNLGRYGASFSNCGKGYICSGYSNTFYFNDLWEYDASSDLWKQKAVFSGAGRRYSATFTIGNKSYIGTGLTTSLNVSDFWVWDQQTNVWTQKANFGGGVRNGAVGFSIGGKGYMGTGINGSNAPTNDLWEYDPSTNLWTQKNSFSGTARANAVAFVIGNKGYVGTGYNYNLSLYLNDFWEFDPLVNSWTPIATLPGNARYNAAAFSVGNYGFVGTGTIATNTQTNDFWRWDRNSNSWTQILDLPGTLARASASSFTINGNGYVGAGYCDCSSDAFTDFWKYVTGLIPPVAVISPASPAPMCLGDSVLLTANSGFNYSYQWFRNGNIIAGATAVNYLASMAGTYTVQVTDTANLSQISAGVKVKIICVPVTPPSSRDANNGAETNEQFIITPNPCSSQISISFNFTTQSEISIEIFNTKAEKVKVFFLENQNAIFQKHNYNISELSPGLYYIKIVSDNFFKFQKLIKLN